MRQNVLQALGVHRHLSFQIGWLLCAVYVFVAFSSTCKLELGRDFWLCRNESTSNYDTKKGSHCLSSKTTTTTTTIPAATVIIIKMFSPRKIDTMNSVYCEYFTISHRHTNDLNCRSHSNICIKAQNISYSTSLSLSPILYSWNFKSLNHLHLFEIFVYCDALISLSISAIENFINTIPMFTFLDWKCLIIIIFFRSILTALTTKFSCCNRQIIRTHI